MVAIENIKPQFDCNDCILNKLSSYDLDDSERKLICSSAVQLHFEKGEQIIKQGASSTSIGFLHKGIVKFTYQVEAK